VSQPAASTEPVRERAGGALLGLPQRTLIVWLAVYPTITTLLAVIGRSAASLCVGFAARLATSRKPAGDLVLEGPTLTGVLGLFEFGAIQSRNGSDFRSRDSLLVSGRDPAN